jgi:hypothetical protein
MATHTHSFDVTPHPAISMKPALLRSGRLDSK